MKNKINLNFINLVPWYIYCKSLSRSRANHIIISTCGKWKKLGVVISMYGEVQNTRNEPNKTQ